MTLYHFISMSEMILTSRKTDTLSVDPPALLGQIFNVTESTIIMIITWQSCENYMTVHDNHMTIMRYDYHCDHQYDHLGLPTCCCT